MYRCSHTAIEDPSGSLWWVCGPAAWANTGSSTSGGSRDRKLRSSAYIYTLTYEFHISYEYMLWYLLPWLARFPPEYGRLASSPVFHCPHTERTHAHAHTYTTVHPYAAHNAHTAHTAHRGTSQRLNATCARARGVTVSSDASATSWKIERSAGSCSGLASARLRRNLRVSTTRHDTHSTTQPHAQHTI
jgi:hypothetical protein